MAFRRRAHRAGDGLRVAGGELRGRRLAAPRGGEARPTTERAREAVFSILGDVRGARVLDLFCGSGALGIEALSRGAARATLVDTRPDAAERNVEQLGLAGRAEVVRSDAARYLAGSGEAFDLVLCDPPYKLADRFAAKIDPLIRDRLAEGARVIVESSPKSPLELSLPMRLERRYGETLVRLYETGSS
ncbi:MAG: RsmD family RNA methyltransferase [Solirubrobacterales bacterium]